MNNNTHEAHWSKTVSDFKILLQDTEELVKATATNVGDKAIHTRKKMEEKLKDVKDRLAVTEAIVVDRTKEYAEATDSFVRENPWKAIGISGCIGLLLGSILTRR